jgi:hypothetical protein
VQGASVNDDRIELIDQTAENRVRKLISMWAESGPIACVTFGNALIHWVILIALSQNIDQSIISSIDVNKRSRRSNVTRNIVQQDLNKIAVL